MDTIKSIKIVVTAISTALAAQLGILAIPVFLLFGLNIADYATAMMAARNRGQDISSNRGLQGIKKKISMYILICLGAVVDIMLTYGAGAAGITIPANWVFALLVTMWLICNELISILENMVDIGVAIPPFLLPLVERIKGTVEIKGEEVEK